MEVDDRAGNAHACPRDFVKQMSLVMDEHGSQTHPRQATTRVSTKSKAPSPPGPDKLNSPGLAQWYPGNPPALSMDHKDNLIDKELSLVVVLPGGVEKMTTVHGSKPLMDLLVTLCAKYHLNPSGHTLELVTTNRNNIKLKPNALIGTLDAEKIIIKPKGEDKNKKTGPQMPEATVRMVINYKQTQKTILRVNPRIPLAELLPAICEKCEFEVESTILLKDVKSLAPLDLSASLNDYAIREVYARDTRVPASPVCPASPTYPGLVTPSKDKNQKEKENKGLFSMFRKSKKGKPDQAPTAASAPSSPVLPHTRPRPLSMALPSTHSSPFGSPGDAPKKRRAPQPPILVSQMSCPSDFSPRQRLYSEPCARLDSTDLTPALSRGSSTDSSLKRTKRKAPPPPTSLSAAASETLSQDDPQASAPANTLEEITEQEETNSFAMSPTADASPGDPIAHNASPDVTPQTPSTEVSVEQNGVELSSDADQLHGEVNDSANALKLEKLDGEELTEVADTSEPSTSEGSTSNNAQADSDTLPSPARLCPPLVRQDAEVQASPPSCVDSPEESADTGAASQPAPSTAEDAQIQTDFAPLPQQQKIIPPDIPPSPALSESSKKDMATLTDDLGETLTLAPAKASSSSSDLESKHKPSNELTRDYIPKVGMTTYTIVPQKSLEKLRYFEVALTLESPPPNSQEILEEKTILQEHDAQKPPTESSKISTSIANQGTENGSIREESTKTNNMSSATTSSTTTSTTDSPAGSPTEVKDIKIPPATKPKPGSFRLPQHKKTPGYYVTSAAEKSQHSACSGTNRRQGNPEGETLPPPPLPPPVQPPEEPEEGATVTPKSPKGEEKPITRQSSAQPSLGLSLEKLRSFAAPRPYSPATPSRFAQAVSSAVKKSQSNAPHSPRSPTLSPSFSPTRSPKFSPVKSQSPLLGLKDQPKVDEVEEHTEKASTIEPVQQGPSFSDIVEMGGETHL